MIFQRTLQRAVTVTGVGLHSGKTASLTFKPASPNAGIVFVRSDLEHHPRIAAHYKNIVGTQLATTLGRGDVRVSTVEHVLAALQFMGIDNAILEVGGPEVPLLDGSAVLFCEAIEKAGVQTQLQSRPLLALRRKVEIKVGEKWAVAEPASRLEIFASIEWDHPAVGYQEFHYIAGLTPVSELASARTFGFLKDVEALRRQGLARGGSLENAVVLDDASVVNPGGLRFPDELVRHKVLDCLGDFKLAGIAIQGYFRLHRNGHDLHSQLLAAVFQNPDNYEVIDGTSSITSESEAESYAARIRAALSHGFAATF